MTVFTALPGFDDLGRSATPTFLCRNGLYLQLSPRCPNIGRQSVQELFFCDRSIHRTVYSNDLLIFFGCDVQQERNWEFIMYIRCYIGSGKIAT